jgi:hypothetical protein
VTEPVTVRRAGPAEVERLAALRRAHTEEDQGPVDAPDFEARYVEWQTGRP